MTPPQVLILALVTGLAGLATGGPGRNAGEMSGFRRGLGPLRVVTVGERPGSPVCVVLRGLEGTTIGAGAVHEARLGGNVSLDCSVLDGADVAPSSTFDAPVGDDVGGPLEGPAGQLLAAQARRTSQAAPAMAAAPPPTGSERQVSIARVGGNAMRVDGWE